MKIFFGILDGLADVGMGRKMHDGVAAAEELRDFCRIGDVADDQIKSVGEGFVAGRKIVVDDDVVTFTAKNVSSVAADVSRAPNHENGQVSLLELS